MNVLDLFSGIGGFSLGLERAGMKTVAFCEIEPYCQRVLKKHWPNVPIYEDVKDVTAERLRADGIPRIDVVTGGFPCQDISLAGKQAGITGERSGLWGELARIISEVQPRYAIVENVTALISGDRGRWFGRVLGDLAEIGYDAEWHCIPASELGAHHHRDRVWIIAYPDDHGSQKRKNVSWINSETPSRIKQGCQNNRVYAAKNTANTGRREQSQGRLYFGIWRQIKSFPRDGSFKCTTEPLLDRTINGIPRRVDRLKGLGNAVVPQIPEIIGRAILEND